MPLANRRILVVDDDEELAETLRELLDGEGYEVCVARDGFDALDQLAAMPPPALILLDWMMPRCNGRAFRNRQKADPAIARIPVVVFTADRQVHVGDDDPLRVLRKPATLEALLGVAADYCGESVTAISA